MKMSESIKAVLPAFAAAQAALKPAVKDAVNPFHKSYYANLESVWDACRDALKANNLVALQPTSGDGATLTVHTMLAHVPSCEFIESDITIAISGMTPQQLGSFITYARRYGLTSLLGIVAVEDDDGNQASQPQTRQPPPPPTRPAPPSVVGPADTLRARIAAAGNEQELQALIPEIQKLAEADKTALRPVYAARAEQLAPVAPAQPAASESAVEALERRLRAEGKTLAPMAWTAFVNEIARLSRADAARIAPLFREVSAARDATGQGRAA